VGSRLSFNTSITCEEKIGGGGGEERGGGKREEEEEKRIEGKKRGLRFPQQSHCVLWSVRIKLQKQDKAPPIPVSGGWCANTSQVFLTNTYSTIYLETLHQKPLPYTKSQFCYSSSQPG